MVIHLVTNASVLDSWRTYQRSVYLIHSLPMLWIIEWTFIFLPLIYHAVYGIVLVRTSQPNNSSYPYGKNWRYTLQRFTGMIAFLFIFWHVFHMHGWIHSENWLRAIKPWWGGLFEPFSATSTGAAAMRLHVLIPIFYAIGVLSCVFHLANGIWTFGITWGAWTTPLAQRRADYVCIAFGVLLALVSMGALGGFAWVVDIKEARQGELQQYNAKIASGELDPETSKHKVAEPIESKEQAKLPAKTEVETPANR
jgi:succinate dehydrogenase / fumarate reductase cytochrome b subunit